MEPRDYNDPRYVKLRKIVFARDKGKCRMPGCPQSDKTRQCHHIRTWSAAPTLRFVPDNCCVLCKTHHEQVSGNEQQWESILAKEINAKVSDVALQMMMMRYGQKPS